MTRLPMVPLLIAVAALAWLAPRATSQSAVATSASSGDVVPPVAGTTRPSLDLIYRRPTERIKLHNYFFDAFGPYPIAAAAIVSGVNQANNTPPEWGQGFAAFGERTGSNFGIAMVTTTVRYGLAEAFREDTIYYRCDCRGIFRRFNHALISTVTARRGDDGHRRLSFPALIAPYAGTMTAVYGWYPSRYGVKDGLRMGNYNLLAFAGVNLAREFIYGGPHTLFKHGARSAAPDPAGHSNP